MDPAFLLSSALVTFHPITPQVVVAIVISVLLLFVSAFASGSEIGFFSLSPQDLSKLNPEKSATDRNINLLREDSERTLATILITNNFVNVTIIMVCNYIFGRLMTFNVAWMQILVMTVLLTFILLLFGEIMPKVFSRQNPLGFCRKAVGGVLFCRKLFWPIESLLMSSGVAAGKIMKKEKRQLSVDDLETALELTDKDDIKDEQNILKGIIRFGDETAKEVMTPRQDIVGIDIKWNFSQVLNCIVENNFSRIPVFQGNDDNIRGVLYIKDLLPYLDKPAQFRWQSLIRAPYFVPETKKIDDLLREFQANKVHIAFVADEYGGTSGLVTMEDILEEIVGEINDEYDDEVRPYSKINYNTYIFEGKTLLSDFCKILGVKDDEFDEVAGDADTVAGMLLEIKGDFLHLHERVDYKNYTFEIMEIQERRISKVKVTVHDPAAHKD